MFLKVVGVVIVLVLALWVHYIKQFYLSNHVLYRLLPENKAVPSNHRSRSRNLVLACKSTFYDDCNFSTPIIFLAMFTKS